MRVVVQRCSNAEVRVEEKVVGKISKGLLLLVAFTEGDTIETLQKMAKKIVQLRIFDDENHVMNRSLLEEGLSVLSISQFTLYADTKKGNRPSYRKALSGDQATILYDEFNQELKKYTKVETGVFGADMKVQFINDGPVTILLESDKNE